MAKSIPAVTIRPLPSRLLARFLLLIHLFALGVTLTAALPVTARIGLLCSLFLYAYYSQRRLCESYPGRVVQVRLTSEGRAGLVTRDGRKRVGALRTDSLVTPWLIILRFRIQGTFRNENLVIARDTLSGEELRRLRVLLRFVRLEPLRGNRSNRSGF